MGSWQHHHASAWLCQAPSEMSQQLHPGSTSASSGMCRAGSGELPAAAGPVVSEREAGLEEERAGEREVADLAEATPMGTDVLAHIQSRLRPVELYAVRFLEEVRRQTKAFRRAIGMVSVTAV